MDKHKAKHDPNYLNINSYAVNVAVYYANALLHYTSYTKIVAIGVTVYKDEFGTLQTKIGVYNVSKENFGIGQKVAEYSDLSFLKESNFDVFVDKVNNLELSIDEAER